jgi:hypothetical protein
LSSVKKLAFNLAVVAVLTACSSDPQIQSPSPAPPPAKSQAPKPPPMESADQPQQSAAAANAHSGSGPGMQPVPSPSASGTNELPDHLPPPSNKAADVEITDIPVDENGDPIVSPNASSETQPPTGESGSQNGGGGATPSAKDGGATGTSGRATAESAIGDGGAPVVNIGAATAEEQAAQLEQNLDTKFAEFDELMRRTREDAERERVSGRGSPIGTSESGQGSRQNPADGAGAGGQADTSSGLGHTPDLVGSDRSGTAHRPAGPIPADIPASRDDDIVARQLREAATSEADPQLRERLWDEYRKYTKGTN